LNIKENNTCYRKSTNLVVTNLERYQQIILQNLHKVNIFLTLNLHITLEYVHLKPQIENLLKRSSIMTRTPLLWQIRPKSHIIETSTLWITKPIFSISQTYLMPKIQLSYVIKQLVDLENRIFSRITTLLPLNRTHINAYTHTIDAYTFLLCTIISQIQEVLSSITFLDAVR